jgi:hypothetical protein
LACGSTSFFGLATLNEVEIGGVELGFLNAARGNRMAIEGNDRVAVVLRRAEDRLRVRKNRFVSITAALTPQHSNQAILL